MPAAWVGAAASAVGAIGSLTSGGGGSSGGSSGSSTGSYNNFDVGSLISGGIGTALGLNQLLGNGGTSAVGAAQAGAAEANPQAQYAAGFETELQQLLQGGITGNASGNQAQEQALLNQILGSANVSTNTAALPTNVSTNTGALPSNISTNTSQLQNLVNNPTQLLKTLQGGGVATPASLSAVANQNPYAMNAGEQFQLDTGQQALDRSMAQTGQVGSGNQMVAAEQYGQQFASQAQAQNIAQMESAQGTINQTSQTNQGLQSILNQMGQNTFSNELNTQQLQTQQQQDTFSNALAGQQLSTQQQQDTASNSLAQQNLQTQQQTTSQTNLQNLLAQLTGINSQELSASLGIIPGLETASQASTSSPATAGSLLSEEFANANNAGSNITSGIGGIANGLSGGLNGIAQGINGIVNTNNVNNGGMTNSGSDQFGDPADLISGFTG